MSQTVKITEDGKITLPREVMGAVKTDVDYRVQVEGNTVKLSPVAEPEVPLWQKLTPAERAKEFLEWAHNLSPRAPILPDEALRRENMYD